MIAGRGTRGLLAVLAPGTTPERGRRARLAQLERELPTPDSEQAWLVLAVLGRRAPDEAAVERFRRRARVDGIRAAFAAESGRRAPGENVAIVVDELLVDVHDTATLSLWTGVQRVARAIGDHWDDAVLVGWSRRGRLRRVDRDAWRTGRRRGALTGESSSRGAARMCFRKS